MLLLQFCLCLSHDLVCRLINVNNKRRKIRVVSWACPPTISQPLRSGKRARKMHARFIFCLQVTTHQIKGEVYEIERLNGCTEVIVNEGYREASYVLDESLIRFGGALDDGEYSLAVSILEPLEVTPEVT